MQEQERRDFLSLLGRILKEEVGHPFRYYITTPRTTPWTIRLSGNSLGEIVKIGEELLRLAESAPPWSRSEDGELKKEGYRLGNRLKEIGIEHQMNDVFRIGDCVVQLAIQPLRFLEDNRSNFDRWLKKPSPHIS